MGNKCWVEFETVADAKASIAAYYRLSDAKRLPGPTQGIQLRLTTDKPYEVRVKYGKLYRIEQIIKQCAPPESTIISNYPGGVIVSMERLLAKIDRSSLQVTWYHDEIKEIFGEEVSTHIQERSHEVE